MYNKKSRLQCDKKCEFIIFFSAILWASITHEIRDIALLTRFQIELIKIYFMIII